MGSSLHHFTAVEHDDLVCIADRAQSMRDDKAGHAATTERGVERELGHRIKRARRLVHDEHCRSAR